MNIEEEIARTLAEYLATDFEHGPFSDTAFARAEVEPDGMVSLFASDSESAWPVASFDAPQLAEWIARSPLLNRVRAEALREAAEAWATYEQEPDGPDMNPGRDIRNSARRGAAVLARARADRVAAQTEQNSEGNET